ncbi:MAG: nicotinamidase/pyrazinamidase [Candidatus Methanolliviera sp. GoM_asphalt]|nr:MAG: nicotinamidase/pyrazinamidase [Candidatus Methanolliviera sp. GoM_asphalt]
MPKKSNLNPERSALIVVDMQNDFCMKDGVLYIEGVEEIFEDTRKAIEEARRSKVEVIFTQDWHEEDDIEFDIWPKHCIKETWGSEIIEVLGALEEDHKIRGRRYSAFFATDLDIFLKESGIEDLVICGVMTNICVLHTAGDASMRGYNVFILKDCVKAPSDYEEEYALKHMENVFNAKVIRSDEI